MLWTVINNLKYSLLPYCIMLTSRSPIKNCHKNDDGFTLIEQVAVTSVIGILAAIGTPSLLGIHYSNQLKNETNQLHLALLYAQEQAQRMSRPCSLEFQKGTGEIINKVTTPQPGCFPSAKEEFDEKLVLKSDLASVTFSFRGMPVEPGIIRLSSPKKVTTERCIQILGGLGMIQQGIYENDECQLLF